MSATERILREIIEARKAEAERRRIFLKARIVAEVFGTRYCQRHGYFFEYKDDMFTIYYEDWPANLTIFTDRVVFSARLGEIESFIPEDTWIRHLEKLHHKALQKIRAEKEKEKQKQLSELAIAWGIDLDRLEGSA